MRRNGTFAVCGDWLGHHGATFVRGQLGGGFAGQHGATMCALYVLIELLGPVSGAHLNPCVTLFAGGMPMTHKPAYVLAQCTGAVLGAFTAHAMFELPWLQWSSTLRSGTGQFLAEVLATACLLFVVHRTSAHKAAGHVAATIGAAYWFTASTSFANPAAVLGRMFSDTFAGIAPQSAFCFVGAQLIGATLGWGLARLLSNRHAAN